MDQQICASCCNDEYAFSWKWDLVELKITIYSGQEVSECLSGSQWRITSYIYTSFIRVTRVHIQILRYTKSVLLNQSHTGPQVTI